MGVILQRRNATLITTLLAAVFAAAPASANAEGGSGEEKLPVDAAGLAQGVASGLTGALESAPAPVGGSVDALEPILNGTLDGGSAAGDGPPKGAPPPTSTPPTPEPGPTAVEPPAAAAGSNGSGNAALSGSSGGIRDATANGTKAPSGTSSPATHSAGAASPGDRPAAGSGADAKSSAREETAPSGDRPEDRGPLERIVTVVPWPVDVAIAVLAALLAVMTFRSLRDRRRLAEAVQLARTDGLTGLANRQDLELFLKRLAAASARSGRPFAVALVDLDRFKAINDDFGHQAGDATLRGVAHALLSELREADHVGRLGGEEFLLILPDTGPHEALGVAERIRERIAAMPRRVDREVTASVGVASTPGDAAGLDELMAAADRALYAAKKAGRDQVVWAGALDPAPDPAEPAAVPA